MGVLWLVVFSTCAFAQNSCVKISAKSSAKVRREIYFSWDLIIFFIELKFQVDCGQSSITWFASPTCAARWKRAFHSNCTDLPSQQRSDLPFIQNPTSPLMFFRCSVPDHSWLFAHSSSKINHVAYFRAHSSNIKHVERPREKLSNLSLASQQTTILTPSSQRMMRSSTLKILSPTLPMQRTSPRPPQRTLQQHFPWIWPRHIKLTSPQLLFSTTQPQSQWTSRLIFPT